MQRNTFDGDWSSTPHIATFSLSRRLASAKGAERAIAFHLGHSAAHLHPSAVISMHRAQPSPGPVLRRKIKRPDGPAFTRERLLRLLRDASRHRVVLVAAPPGFGKTSLLAQFAAQVRHPVAWYRADARDAAPDALVHHLSCALTTEVVDLEGRWSDVDALIHALESWEGDRLALVIDDLHTLAGTAAEEAVARLVTYLPAHVTLLLGTRSVPSFDISRLRVSGELLDIGPEELRFRSGEAERLFREFYDQPLPPDELAELIRRTQGWPAALRLFHLATQGKPGAERRQVLCSLQGRSKLVREYLTRNLLDELPTRLRGFLLRTSVLGVLSAALCDQLRDATDSGELLVELEKRRLFTSRLEDGEVYRYHGILRSHLIGILCLESGQDAARALHRRAGELLEQAGEPGWALEAYAQAEEWDAATRVLGREGETLARDASGWLLSLPSSLVEDDPWLQLATARRHLAAGAFESAVRAYARCEELFRGAVPAAIPRRERRNLAAWSGSGSAFEDDWVGVLLSAVRGQPMAVGRRMTDAGPGMVLACGVALLLAGEVREAEAALRVLTHEKDVEPGFAAATELAASIAGMLGRAQGGHARLLDAVETCERLQYTWLAHLGRAAMLLDPTAQARQGQPPPVPGGGAGQQWRQAVAALFAGLGALHDQDGEAGPPERGLHEAAGLLESAAEAFHRLNATTLEGWARAALAIAQARTGSPRARWTLRIAERLAADSQARGVEALVAAAAAELDGELGDELRAKAAALAQRTGLAVPGVGIDDLGPQAPKTTAHEVTSMGGRTRPTGVRPRRERSIAAGAGRIQVTAPHTRAGRRAATAVGEVAQREARREAGHEASLVLRCFGEFSLDIRGQHVEESAVKPRVRSLLHLLALHAGRPVHRETLIEALWPEADMRSGTRNLHVALSSLRQLFEPGVPRGASSLLVRTGDSYRLALPPDADVDLLRFDRAFHEGRAARGAGDHEGAARAFTAALHAQGGELLPSEGPAEWVVKERERYRLLAADAAEGLAEALLALGDAAGAAAACERGLTIDRYRDGLWRLLAEAREQSGDPAAASQARRNYREMLLELGLQHPES